MPSAMLNQNLRGWGRRKPLPANRLDRSHALSRGIVRAALCNEGGGPKILDLARLTACGIAGVVGGSTWTAGRFNGAAVALDGSTNYLDLGIGTAFTKATPFTVFVTFKTTTATCALAANWNVNVTPGWQMILASGQIGMSLLSASGFAGYAAHGTRTLNDGAWHTGVVSYDGSGANTGIRLYVDGSPETLTLGANTDPGALTDSGLLIGDRAGSALKMAGAIEQAMVWNRTLSPGEVGWHYAEPYAMMQSPQPRLFAGFGYFLRTITADGRLKAQKTRAVLADGKLRSAQARSSLLDGWERLRAARVVGNDGRLGLYSSVARLQDGRLRAYKQRAVNTDGRLRTVKLRNVSNDGRMFLQMAGTMQVLVDARLHLWKPRLLATDGRVRAATPRTVGMDGRERLALWRGVPLDGRLRQAKARVLVVDGKMALMATGSGGPGLPLVVCCRSAFGDRMRRGGGRA